MIRHQARDMRMSDNRSHEPAVAAGSPVDYNRAALAHLLGIHPWRRWEDMLAVDAAAAPPQADRLSRAHQVG